MRAISKSDKHHIHLDMYLGQIGYRIWDMVPSSVNRAIELHVLCTCKGAFTVANIHLLCVHFAQNCKKCACMYSYVVHVHVLYMYVHSEMCCFLYFLQLYGWIATFLTDIGMLKFTQMVYCPDIK